MQANCGVTVTRVVGSAETSTAANPDGWGKVGYSQFRNMYQMEGQLTHTYGMRTNRQLLKSVKV